MPRHLDPAAIDRVAGQLRAGIGAGRSDLAEAARGVTAALAARHPGHTIEVRVPPFAAVQVGTIAGDGPAHHRGTPPNVVEMSAETLVRLAAGDMAWADAVAAGLVRHSGAHAADVATMLPL